VPAPSLPVDRLHRIGVVVRDLEAAATAYAELFGIDRWDVRQVDGDRLARLDVRGRPVQARYRTATGALPSGAAVFELIEAGVGETTYQYLRCTRQQGVHHLTLAADPSAFAEVLRGCGVDVAQTEHFTDGSTATLFDTRELLGGFYLRVEQPSDVDSEPDERWDLSSSYRRPDGQGPLAVTQLHHLGVVVRDVVAKVERSDGLFGIATWPFMNWRPEPGRLEAPFYRGQPVDHGYFCGMGFNYRNFGWEIIQPGWGPSHYADDFLDVVGEGVHHMQLVYPADADEWDGIVAWLAERGIPVIMGSPLRGGATTFYYLDTRAALGGWSVEATIRSPDADPSKRIYDFTAQFPDVVDVRTLS
jgi:hypothetical protein